MDICVSTSRGRDLVLPNQHVIPGGLLNELVDEALSRRNRWLMRRAGGPNFVYILGGLPDTTVKIKDKEYKYLGRVLKQKYTEVIFPDSPYHVDDQGTRIPTEQYTQLVRKFQTANARILQAGAIPVFATVTTMSIPLYNEHCYEQNWTTYQIHSDQYEDMQYLLNDTLDLLNNEICRINDANLVETPHLAACVTSKRGVGQGHRVRYSRLWDGCHAGQNLAIKWQSIMDGAIPRNRDRHTPLYM